MHHSLWATPLDPVYDTIIAQLAERFKTPHFPAHVTILEGFESHASDPRFSQLSHAPFELTFERVAITDDPAVVLEADPSEAYSKIAHEACGSFGGRIPDRIHLSLVYLPQNPTPVKELIEQSFTFPLTISFKRLELWDTKGPLTAASIKEWTILSRKALG
ncbi:MAG: 2'-5' RNA ligase family protein [Candidatus Woesearchaeota archaeon]